MLKISDGKIGVREYFAIILFTLAMKATDTTPDLMIFAGKNATWILALIYGVVMLLPLLVLLRLIKKHNKGLSELLTGLVGKFLGTLLGTLLFLIMIITTSLNSRSYIDILNTLFYPTTPIFYLLLILLITTFIIAILGFETIGRACWIIMWYVLAALTLFVILVWENTNWLHLYPIAGPGLDVLLEKGVRQSSIMGEIIVFGALYPFVRSYKEYRNATLLGFLISVIALTFHVALYTAVYDYPAVEFLNYPFQQLARVASFGGSSTNLESLFLFFWVITSVFHFAIYLYVTVMLFGKIAQIDSFEKLLLPFTGLIFLLSLLPTNIIQVNLYRIQFIKIVTIVSFSIPFLLWFMDWWKGRVRR